MKKNVINNTIALMIMGLSVPAFAQGVETYQNRPIVMPIHVNQGEPADVLAQIFAEGIKKHYGQTVQIEYMPQQGGVRAINEVVNSDPDGFTLTFTNLSTLLSAPADTDKNLEKLTIVSEVATTPNIFFVNNSSAKDYKSYEAETRKNRNHDNIATGGKGVSNNLDLHNMKKEYDLAVNIMPYASSNAIVGDVATGKIQGGYIYYSAANKAISEGKVTPLAIGSQIRIKELANIPTFKDLGMDNVNKDASFGIISSAGMTPETKAKVNEMIDRVFKDSETMLKIEKAGFKNTLIKETAALEKIKNEAKHYGAIYSSIY